MKLCTYTKYKDAGIDWIGSIPTQWQFIRLKYCVDLINEKVDGSETDLPYTGLEHIESWTGKRIAAENGSATSDGQANRYKAGDVLFGKLRPYLAKVLRSNDEGICTGELLVLRPKAVIQDYLFNYLLSKDFVTIVDSSTYGAKMPRASWEFIGNLPILLPPDEEQRAIACFLDWETERIDQLIAKKKRQIDLLQEKRTAFISHAVTKGLNPKAKMKDSRIEWLGEIPAHWEVIPIKRITSIPVTDGPHETPEFLDDGIPFISAEAIKNDKIDFSKKRGFISAVDHARFSKKYKPQKGDVYIVKSGATTGNVAYVATVDEEFNIWSPLAVIRPHRRKAITLYVFFLMKSLYFFQSIEIRWSYGTQQNIGMNVIENLSIALPPLSEQRAIADFLDLETARIDVLIEKVKKSIELLREYRTTLISGAVTGKIDVRKEVVI